MKKTSMRKLSRIISYIITVMLLIGMIGGAAYVVKIMLGSYDSFSIIYGEETYIGYTADKVYPFNTEINFTVAYDYNKLVLDKQYGYTVKVVPAASGSDDFEFSIGDHSYMFSDEQDITSAFNVVISDDSFSIVIPGNISDVLGVIYGGGEITVPELDNDKDYYKLIVTAFDGTEISISFKQYSVVTGVILDKDTLIIGDYPVTNNQPVDDNTNNDSSTNTGGSTIPDETTEPGGGFSGGGGGAR